MMDVIVMVAFLHTHTTDNLVYCHQETYIAILFPSLHSESGHVERGKMHGGSKRIGRVRKSGRERVRKGERRRKEKRNVSIRVCFESFDKGLNSK